MSSPTPPRPDDKQVLAALSPFLIDLLQTFEAVRLEPDMMAVAGNLEKYIYDHIRNLRDWLYFLEHRDEADVDPPAVSPELARFFVAVGQPSPHKTSALEFAGLAGSAGPAAASDAPSTAGWQPFPLDSMPRQIADYAVAVSRVTGVDPAGVAIGGLVSLAGAIGNARMAQVADNWTEPAAIFAATVVSPGHGWQPSSILRWSMPPSAYFLTPTVEVFVAHLLESPRGLLAAIPELGNWIRQASRMRNNRELSLWLTTAQGQQILYRRPDGDVVRVERALMSFYGTLETSFFQSVKWSDFDPALMNRLLVACPPVSASWPLRTGEFPSPSSYFELIDAIRELSFDPHGEPARLEFTPEAQSIFQSWAGQRLINAVQLDGEFIGTLGKLDGYCARFALCLALADDPASMLIEACHVIDAIELTDWFTQEARRVHAMRSAGQPQEGGVL